MARLFPDKPIGSAAPEVARLFRVLKQLPDDWNVWFHLKLGNEEMPDFLVLDSQGRALLLAVGRATPQQASLAPQLQMFDLGPKTAMEKPGEAEERSLDKFMAQLEGQGLPREAVTSAVIFPHLTKRNIRVIRKIGAAPHYRWLDKTWVNDPDVNAWRNCFIADPLDENGVHTLRALFSPEVIVPASFVARVQRRRRIEAELDDYLLDYDQEYVLKTDLDLAVEGKNLSRDFRIQVINGVAGSGKTLVLLYRLRLLHNLFPDKEYLVLTHNRPLIRDMRVRFRLLKLPFPPAPRPIRWYTFQGWCRANWPNHQQYNPISIDKRNALIRQTWTAHLDGSGISVGMFKSELEWVKDNGFATREEYFEAIRRGRGFRLTQKQRERMFEAILAYQNRLVRQDEMDWWDVPRRMWHWIEEGKVALPRYDVVMIDEAQFFAPVWFDIVRHLTRPETGYLFLAADPTQGFLHRGESWRSITGLEVRGRSHQLRRSYRTTRAILTCAQNFYRQRLPDDDEGLLLPNWAGMQAGKPPLLLQFDSPQDERARVVNEIVQIATQGFPLRHILILCTSWRGEKALREALVQRLGEEAAKDPKDNLPGDFVRVTTINAGTGLEAPIVFVVGLREMFEREKSLRLGKDEREELVQENTRKLYMAFTRAGQRLILTCVGNLPSSLLGLVHQGLIRVDTRTQRE